MELVTRITSNENDVEVIINNFYKNEVIEKRISLKKYLQVLDSICNKDNTTDSIKPLRYLDENIIGYASNVQNEWYLIKQPQHSRFITYSFNGESGAFKIKFPNSVYLIEVKDKKIKHIQAYMYLHWNGKETSLYKYGMPNMLTEDRVCIGSAKNDYKDNIIDSLESIIYSPYSHSNLNNVKGFSGTKEYFEYLSKNEIKKKYLYSANLKIKDLVI